jgi:hypothetical protein
MSVENLGLANEQGTSDPLEAGTFAMISCLQGRFLQHQPAVIPKLILLQ